MRSEIVSCRTSGIRTRDLLPLVITHYVLDHDVSVVFVLYKNNRRKKKKNGLNKCKYKPLNLGIRLNKNRMHHRIICKNNNEKQNTVSET